MEIEEGNITNLNV